MHVISINVGSARRVGNSISGIYKNPVDGPVFVSRLGVDSDVIGDSRSHGGPDQALYVYGGDDYRYWNQELGRELRPGTFGDNLVISDLSCIDVKIGDRFQIDHVQLEATGPRIPCDTLGRRMDDRKFPISFRLAARPGFYCRVLNEGDMQAGTSVKRCQNADTTDQTVSIVEMFHLYYEAAPTISQLERLLAAPIAERYRERFESKLKNIQA